MQITEYLVTNYISNLCVFENTKSNKYQANKRIIRSYIFDNHLELISKSLKDLNNVREFIKINSNNNIAYPITISNLLSKDEKNIFEKNTELKNAYLKLKNQDILNGIYIGFKVVKQNLTFNVINKVTTKHLGTHYILSELDLNLKNLDAETLKLDLFKFFLKTKILEDFEYETSGAWQVHKVNYDFIGFTKALFHIKDEIENVIIIHRTIDLVKFYEFSNFKKYNFTIISETKESCYCNLVDGRIGYLTKEDLKEIIEHINFQIDSWPEYREDYREDYNNAFEVDNNEFEGWYEPID